VLDSDQVAGVSVIKLIRLGVNSVTMPVLDRYRF